MKRIVCTAVATLSVLMLYLLFWPVPIDPVAYDAPESPAYTGVFAQNQILKNVQLINLPEGSPAESIILGPDRRLYAAQLNGKIARFERQKPARVWTSIGGLPTGTEFDRTGNLWTADSDRGIVRVAPNGSHQVVCGTLEGLPLQYADDVTVGPDGRIYFTEATAKFPARTYGLLPACDLDIVEHRANGKIGVCNPRTGTAIVLAGGFYFPNGITLSHMQDSLLFAESGMYRISRLWLKGPRRGVVEVLVDRLPGFVDNIDRGRGGRYWVALVAPRSKELDALARRPAVRRALLRLPRFLLPAPPDYAHVIVIDEAGKVVVSLQDPAGGFPGLTDVQETDEGLYFGSVRAGAIGFLPRSQLPSAVR